MSVGLELSAVRSRTGAEVDLTGAFPSADYFDATQVSAVAVSRRFGLGLRRTS